jgi:hypothetical protein
MISDSVSLSQSQCYNGNKKLKKAGISLQYTKDQIEEILHCRADPIYFIRNYVKIINLDKGLMHFLMYPFQEEMVQTFHDNRFVLCLLPRQSGKCCDINTIIKVRNKLTGEINELSIGDFYEMQKDRRDQQCLQSLKNP